MHLAGLGGMPRRIYTYPAGLGLDGLNMTATVGSFILGIGILISIVNFFQSQRTGALAGRIHGTRILWNGKPIHPPHLMEPSTYQRFPRVTLCGMTMTRNMTPTMNESSIKDA